MKFLIIICVATLSLSILGCVAGQRVKLWGDTSGKSMTVKEISVPSKKGTVQNHNLTFHAVSPPESSNIAVLILLLTESTESGYDCSWYPAVGEECAHQCDYQWRRNWTPAYHIDAHLVEWQRNRCINSFLREIKWKLCNECCWISFFFVFNSSMRST